MLSLDSVETLFVFLLIIINTVFHSYFIFVDCLQFELKLFSDGTGLIRSFILLTFCWISLSFLRKIYFTKLKVVYCHILHIFHLFLLMFAKYQLPNLIIYSLKILM